MLSHRFYYALKPFLPWDLRIRMRRVLARRKLKSSAAVWPIDQSASQPPVRWPGWPEGKKFAFVITHDVEGPDGLAKCRQLAELEMSLGFRSSFNFIPEGGYTVPTELRSWLTGHGFEVGVHDLNHDGKLFVSHRGFRQKAKKINHYLREWRARGYRSGFMLRNLEWMHELDVLYDSSTFDTDPFELQSTGVGTIFPYWIPTPVASPAKAAKQGYVELPYTLPQDSTLFLVLQEASPEIWFRKIDWIARHGGMALVNVHPDYINFGSRQARNREYPAARYVELLQRVRDQFAGQSWNSLPRDLAEWYLRACHPELTPAFAPAPSRAAHATELPRVDPRLQGKRAAVLLYSRYPSDPRPRRAAEAMIEAGMKVDLLCLSDSAADLERENVGGVEVVRLRMTHRRDSKWIYLWQYGRFFVASFWFLSTRTLRRRYDVVHVHNMPDFLVFAAVVPKLRGARIILDLHDPMPELMESIYRLETNNWKVNLLRRLERWSIAFSNLVLTPNITFKNLFVSRSCPSEKMQIVMNSPQEEIFDPARFPAAAQKAHDPAEFHVMHHGSIVHRHGVDFLVAAVARLRPAIPGIRLDIYGHATPFLTSLMDEAQRLGIADIVQYHGDKSQIEIAEAILNCDVGVVPNRRTPFTNLNFPTRLFEYLSMHRPVIAPATQGIQDYFSDDQLITFKADDVTDLADKILWVHRNPAVAAEFVQRGLAVYREHLWRNEKNRFTSLIAATIDA